MLDEATVHLSLDQAAESVVTSQERLFVTVTEYVREGRFDPIVRGAVTSWVHHHPDLWAATQMAWREKIRNA
ncbi:MAG TPA: hypothetical protein VF303_03575 [Candidatus Nanoarchaeia archaeon]